jgi:hypothetical protein
VTSRTRHVNPALVLPDEKCSAVAASPAAVEYSAYCVAWSCFAETRAVGNRRSVARVLWLLDKVVELDISALVVAFHLVWKDAAMLSTK